jgi:hypothetical protein
MVRPHSVPYQHFKKNVGARENDNIAVVVVVVYTIAGNYLCIA